MKVKLTEIIRFCEITASYKWYIRSWLSIEDLTRNNLKRILISFLFQYKKIKRKEKKMITCMSIVRKVQIYALRIIVKNKWFKIIVSDYFGSVDINRTLLDSSTIAELMWPSIRSFKKKKTSNLNKLDHVVLYTISLVVPFAAVSPFSFLII